MIATKNRLIGRFSFGARAVALLALAEVEYSAYAAKHHFHLVVQVSWSSSNKSILNTAHQQQGNDLTKLLPMPILIAWVLLFTDYPNSGILFVIMKNVPIPIAEATLKYHAELLKNRAQAMQEWNSKIGEIETFMRENGIEFQSGLVLAHLASEPQENMPVATAVKAKAKAMILPGVSVPTDEIARSLAADGMTVEPARITRILSGTGWYKGHKTKGWSLRGEAQTDGRPFAASSATKSDEDEL